MLMLLMESPIRDSLFVTILIYIIIASLFIINHHHCTHSHTHTYSHLFVSGGRFPFPHQKIPGSFSRRLGKYGELRGEERRGEGGDDGGRVGKAREM
jgi:hypothetical protein